MVHFEGRGLVVPIATTASTYAAGRMVGGLNKLSSVLPDSNGSLRLMSLSVSDTAKQAKGFDLLFFNKLVTVPADNAAFDISAADCAFFIGSMVMLDTDYFSSTSRSFASRSNIRHILQAGKSSLNAVNLKDLWCALVTTGAPTYTANCLKLTLGLELAR